MATPMIVFSIRVMRPRRPANSLLARSQTPIEPLRKFLASYKPEQTFEDVWKDIQRRYDACYGADERDMAYFSNLQTTDGNDIMRADTVGSLFLNVPRNECVLYVQQVEIDRDCSIPVDSHLRPKSFHKRVSDDLTPERQQNLKRRQVQQGKYGATLDELNPETPVVSRESHDEGANTGNSQAIVLVEDSQHQPEDNEDAVDLKINSLKKILAAEMVEIAADDGVSADQNDILPASATSPFSSPYDDEDAAILRINSPEKILTAENNQNAAGDRISTSQLGSSPPAAMSSISTARGSLKAISSKNNSSKKIRTPEIFAPAPWTKEEDRILIKGRQDKLSYAEIKKRSGMNRNLSAMRNRYRLLKTKMGLDSSQTVLSFQQDETSDFELLEQEYASDTSPIATKSTPPTESSHAGKLPKTGGYLRSFQQRTTQSRAQKSQFSLHLQSGHMDELANIITWDRNLVGDDGKIEVGRPGFTMRLEPHHCYLRSDNELYEEAKQRAKPAYVKEMHKYLKLGVLSTLAMTIPDPETNTKVHLLRTRLRRHLRQKMGLPLRIYTRPRMVIAGMPEPDPVDENPPGDDESLLKEMRDLGVDDDLEVEVTMMDKGVPDTLKEFLKRAEEANKSPPDDEEEDEDQPEAMDCSREIVEVVDEGEGEPASLPEAADPSKVIVEVEDEEMADDEQDDEEAANDEDDEEEAQSSDNASEDDEEEPNQPQRVVKSKETVEPEDEEDDDEEAQSSDEASEDEDEESNLPKAAKKSKETVEPEDEEDNDEEAQSSDDTSSDDEEDDEEESEEEESDLPEALEDSKQTIAVVDKQEEAEKLRSDSTSTTLSARQAKRKAQRHQNKRQRPSGYTAEIPTTMVQRATTNVNALPPPTKVYNFPPPPQRKELTPPLRYEDWAWPIDYEDPPSSSDSDDK